MWADDPALADNANRRLDLRNPFDVAQFFHQLERHLRSAFERRPFGRVEMDGPLTHVLVRHELPADHSVERQRE